MISKVRFEVLKLSGNIVKALLVPEMAGGAPDDNVNLIWLYKNAAIQKLNFDNELRRAIDQVGGQWKYLAEPRYESPNFMPSSISIVANSDQGDVLEMNITNSIDADRSLMPEFTQGTDSSGDVDDFASEAFSDLFLQHVAAAFDKQLRLAELIGEKWSWNLDTINGVLTFTDNDVEQVRVPVQIIGTECHKSKTWLWVWANQQSKIPASLIQTSNKMLDFGRDNGIPEFTQQALPLGQVTGDMISMVATGLFESSCYFRGTYEGGAIFLLIEKMPGLSAEETQPFARIMHIFMRLMNDLEIDDPLVAFVAYTRYYGLETIVDSNRVIAKHPNYGRLIAEFDEFHRLTQLSASLESSE